LAAQSPARRPPLPRVGIVSTWLLVGLTVHAGTNGGMGLNGVDGSPWVDKSFRNQRLFPGVQTVSIFSLSEPIVHTCTNGGTAALGGLLVSPPTAVCWGRNRIDIFGVGTDTACWHNWWDGTVWGGWESLGGKIVSQPTAVSRGPNTIDVFANGTDHALYHISWDGSSWGGWEWLGGILTSAPTAVARGEDRLDIFGLGTDHAIYHLGWEGSWGVWECVGGIGVSTVGVCSWAVNRLDLFVVGTDSACWHKSWDGSSWSEWESKGGICESRFSCVCWSADRIDIFTVGTDSACHHLCYGQVDLSRERHVIINYPVSRAYAGHLEAIILLAELGGVNECNDSQSWTHMYFATQRGLLGQILKLVGRAWSERESWGWRRDYLGQCI
jgi:hypothetical protein